MKTAAEVAVELLDIRNELNILRNAEKAVAEELKKRMNGGERQHFFKFVDATTMKIADAIKARIWAEKYAPSLVIVDATAARQLFLGDVATGSMGSPEANGFKLQTTQRLTEVGGARNVAGELPEIT